MNWDRIEGNWKQLKGRVQHAWGNLTHDQFEVIAGKRARQSGLSQAAYGYCRESTEKQLAARQVARK